MNQARQRGGQWWLWRAWRWWWQLRWRRIWELHLFSIWENHDREVTKRSVAVKLQSRLLFSLPSPNSSLLYSLSILSLSFLWLSLFSNTRSDSFSGISVDFSQTTKNPISILKNETSTQLSSDLNQFQSKRRITLLCFDFQKSLRG